MSARACLAAIKDAGSGLLDDGDVDELLTRVQDRFDRARADRRAARADVALREGVAKDAEALRLEAALARKHAALTILARQRVLGQVAVMRAAGLDPRKSVLAVLEGSARGIAGARASVAATAGGYRARYLGRLFEQLDALSPRIIARLRDEDFLGDVVREMRSLGDESGKAATENRLARQVAEIFAGATDEARRDINRLGGQVGELAGWSPQAHDRGRIAGVERKDWVEFVLAKLDLERSFPDLDGDEVKIRGVLDELYDTITSGVDRVTPDRDQALAASRVTPTPNLARALGRHRTLHFRDADAWLDYRQRFGRGHVFDSVIGHLERSARLAGQMEVLGPNPGYTLTTVLDRLRAEIREAKDIEPAAKKAMADALSLDRGDGIKSAYAEMQGLTFGVGGNESMAQIGSELRAWQGVAKLGGAFISSVFSDPWVQAANLRFLGRGWADSIASQVTGFLAWVPSAERKRVAYRLGQGFDTLAQRMTSSYFAHDGAPGVMQRLLNWTMRYQGLSGFTDHLRGTGARLMAQGLGENATAHNRRGWAGVEPRLRHALELHGIDAVRFGAIAQASAEVEAGARVLTPDAVRTLDDAAVVPVVGAERLDRAAKAAAERARADAYRQLGTTARSASSAQKRQVRAAGDEAAEVAKRRLIDGERRRLEVQLAAFFNDELRSFSVIEPNAQTRRIMLRGSQRGTWMGEIARAMVAFKSYPVGFSTGPLARQIHGGPGQRSAGVGNIAMLIAGLAVMGYAAMTAKDFVRGYGPRDPREPKTLLAALLQSGGLGIYGDFLFAEANRFGGSSLATLAGPLIGESANLIDLAQRARNGEATAAEGLNWTMRNSPFVNLWWLRPGLDFLILNELRDAASPGWLARQQRRRAEEFGQQPLPWVDATGGQLDIF